MSTRRRPRPDRERGVALLSALLTVALLTVIVIEMTDATMVHTHLSRNAGNALAAQLLARSAAIAGEELVSQDATNPGDVTCNKNIWALPLVLPAGSGTVALQLTDEGGKLDLNTVGDSTHTEIAEKLFATLGLDQTLVGAIKAWIRMPGANPSDRSMATGEASDYCALSMPCAPRHQPLNSLEELALIRGFGDHEIAALRPFATVIPRPASGTARPTAPPINAITARPELLAAIGCENAPVPDCPMAFGKAQADEGKGKQKNDYGQSFTEWKNSNCPGAAGSLLAMNSVYFSIEAHGVVGDMNQGIRVLVKRSSNRVDRLAWQEHLPTDALPTEVR